LARINDNCLVQLTRQHYSPFSGLSLMTYHRELCLFPAIIQIAFGDVNSSRLINHASRDSLTLRMSNVLASHLFFLQVPQLANNLSPHFISFHFQDVTQTPGGNALGKFDFFFFKMQFATALGWQSRDVCVTHV